MAKLIQLKDGTENLYPDLYYKLYTLTRVENPYANATSIGRITLRRYGQLGILYFNFQPSTSIPASQNAFVTIGTYDCTLMQRALVTIPCQVNASVLTVQFEPDGTLQIYNGSATASGINFFRACIPVLFSVTSN